MFTFLTSGTVGDGFVAFMLLFLLLYLSLLFALIGLSVVSYILEGFGLQKMASKRGIHKPWLAWVPVGNMWIMGSISDQYQYVKKGRVTNRRKRLLGLMIAYFAIVMTYSFVSGIAAGMASVTGTVSPIVGVMANFFYLLMIAVANVMFVFMYIALYDLYASAVPEKAKKYLLLSIFISPTLPFLIFRCRDKEDGMPPRKDAQIAEIPAPETEEEAPVTEEGFAAAEEFEEDPAETVTVMEEIEVTEEVTETDFAEEQETNQPTEE